MTSIASFQIDNKLTRGSRRAAQSQIGARAPLCSRAAGATGSASGLCGVNLRTASWCVLVPLEVLETADLVYLLVSHCAPIERYSACEPIEMEGTGDHHAATAGKAQRWGGLSKLAAHGGEPCLVGPVVLSSRWTLDAGGAAVSQEGRTTLAHLWGFLPRDSRFGNVSTSPFLIPHFFCDFAYSTAS